MFRAASTLHVTYRIYDGLGLSAATLNRGVRRVAPVQDARFLATDPVFAEFTGRITVPMLTLHNTDDARVPFRVEQDYRRGHGPSPGPARHPVDRPLQHAQLRARTDVR